MFDYLLIFASAFLSATLLPGSSEVVVVTQIMSHPENGLWIWLVASLGNTLGSVVNWLLGLYLLHFQHRSWFPVNQKQMERAQHWFQKYGVWSLLMAWVPVIGDALPLAAGVMKVRFWVLGILVFLGKGTRYLILIYIADVALN